MTVITQSANRVGGNCHSLLKAASFTVNKAEPLEKVLKMGYKSIEFVLKYRQIVSKSFSHLAMHMKGTTEFLETFQVFGRLADLLVPDVNGKYFIHKNPWQKCADRVTLAAHSTLKSIRALAKFKLIDLGRVGAVSIGKLPIFSLVTDGFVILSNIFSIWDNVNKLSKIRTTVSNAEMKVEKWSVRPLIAAFVEAGSEIEIENLKVEYTTKLESVSAELERLQNSSDYLEIIGKTRDGKMVSPGLILEGEGLSDKEIGVKQAKGRETAEKITRLQLSSFKYQKRLAMIDRKDYHALADDLVAKNSDFKLRKWEVILDNEKLLRTKASIGIINSIGKISIVSFILVLTSLNLWRLPYELASLGFGFLVDSIGYTKVLFENFNKPKPLPRLELKV